MAEIKIGGKTRFENLLIKVIIAFALVGYEVIITSLCHAIVGYFITSYPNRAHGIIVMEFQTFFPEMRKDNRLEDKKNLATNRNCRMQSMSLLGVRAE